LRILILVDDYYPSAKSGAKMIHDLGKELLKSHNVTIVTPSDQASKPMHVAVEDGIRVVRVKTGNLKNVSRPLRAWRESRLSSDIWRRAHQYFADNPHELVIFYSPTIFFASLVRRLKIMWRCPAYLVLRDIFPKWAVEAGIIHRDGVLHRYFRRRERQQYAAADIIGVESPGNLAYFDNDVNLRRYSREVLYSWTEQHLLKAHRNDYRSRLNLIGKVVFFYGGNIGVAQDMDNIVRLAQGLQQYDNIFFLLVGEGSEVFRLKADINRHELNNIAILPAVGQEEYLRMLSEFDVGMISLDRRLTSHNIPGKLFGYMNNKMPVLASLNSGNDLGALLRLSEAGIACDNGDDNCLRLAALGLANDPELRSSMGRNSGALLSARFSVSAAATQITSHFQPSGQINLTSGDKLRFRPLIERSAMLDGQKYVADI
jgi:glycosyltransferase involved in cell wall biosynthesis